MVTNQIEKLINDIQYLKDAITTKINSLPDNPVITRIDKRCFTINKSQLSKDLVLSPYYYDFKYQYKMINKKINSIPLEAILPALNRIIKEEHISDSDFKRFRINPVVVEYLKVLLTH